MVIDQRSFCPASWIGFLCRVRAVQIIEMFSEDCTKIEQFEVFHVHLLRLDLGQPTARAVPAFHLKFGGEFFLGPTVLIPQFSDDWTNGVLELWLRHP